MVASKKLCNLPHAIPAFLCIGLVLERSFFPLSHKRLDKMKIGVYTPNMNEYLSRLNAAQLAEIEATCACSNVRKAARAVTQLYDDVLQPIGLRSTQFTLLIAVALAGEASVT